MAEIIIMPKLGFNMSEGKLVEWYKKEGEPVKKGEPLFSIETDKTTMDIEATKDGILKKILLREGETIPVTLPVCIVGGADETGEEEARQAIKILEEAGISANKVSPDLSFSGNAAPSDASSEGRGEGGTGSIAEKEKEAGSGTEGCDFDIIVIGGGPGGYVAAIKGAQSGKKTAVIEQGRFGGVCLNEGCIPTKALLHSVSVLKDIRRAAEMGVSGVSPEKTGLDMKNVQARKKKAVSELVRGVEMLLEQNGVTVLTGEGRLTGRNTVAVGEKIFRAENIIVATGSDAVRIPVETHPAMPVLTSREALELEKLPGSVVIAGGGVIGIELAYFFAAAGVKVTVLELLDRILTGIDGETAQNAVKMLESMGIGIHTGARLEKIEKDSVAFKQNGQPKTVKTEMVLMAAGRKPRLSGIDCEALGIRTDEGAIITDGKMRTSVPGIYAVGDVNGKKMLAHTAFMEAIVAVKNICGEEAEMDYGNIPGVVYISPEIAGVGLTGEEAENAAEPVRISKFPLLANGKAKVEGENDGFVKVISDPKYGEILGVHIYGPHAADLIGEAALAMKLEATAEEAAMTVHPHPSISEALQEAFHGAAGKYIHF